MPGKKMCLRLRSLDAKNEEDETNETNEIIYYECGLDGCGG